MIETSWQIESRNERKISSPSRNLLKIFSKCNKKRGTKKSGSTTSIETGNAVGWSVSSYLPKESVGQGCHFRLTETADNDRNPSVIEPNFLLPGNPTEA